MSSISRLAGRQAGILALFAACFTMQAEAQAPAAPSVTVGAGIKRLEFQWNAVANTSFYELWFKADAATAYVRLSQIPASRTRVSTLVSAHLFNWVQARYRVTACNSSGCNSSAPLSVAFQSRRATGYFKSDFPEFISQYGTAVVVSEDGKTMAVGTTEGDRSVVYVYGLLLGRWSEEVRLVVPQEFPGSGGAWPTISGDGNVLAVATGDTVGSEEGVVHVYRRESGIWQHEQRLLGNGREDPFDAFGLDPDISEDGTRLLISYTFGRTELYRHTAGGWVLDRQLPRGNGFVLSGDGNVITRCRRPGGALTAEIFRVTAPASPITVQLAPASQDRSCGAVDIDYYGVFVVVGSLPPYPSEDARVSVVRRVNGQYGVVATVTHGSWQRAIDNRVSNFGETVRLSRTGEYLAVTDVNDTGAGHDIMLPPLQTSSVATGAVYVFQRSGNAFRLRNVLKPHLVAEPDFHFGEALAFGDRGRTLAVGHPSENSAASGIGGDRNDTSLTAAGAVWLY